MIAYKILNEYFGNSSEKLLYCQHALFSTASISGIFTEAIIKATPRVLFMVRAHRPMISHTDKIQ